MTPKNANPYVDKLKKMINQPIPQEDASPEERYTNDVSKYDNAVIVSKLFSTKNGEKVLELLMDQTINKPSWYQYASTEAAVTNGLYREGQNSIMRLIANYLALAASGPPSKPQLTKNPIST